jgi:DNA excision repair protein ERCC-3
LIGPKKYDIPWHDLERQGWIAPAICYEIRTTIPKEERLAYVMAERRQKYRLASSNSHKLDVLERLLAYHKGDRILIIGMYLDQLNVIAKKYDFPLITGKTKVSDREALYSQFRTGDISTLVVSKVANFSIDLPDANVAIQISGSFGSRQEEAQRLGRILRPKAEGRQAHFYSLVTNESIDQDYSANRQRFLTEQGYRYIILYDDEIPTALPHTQNPA